MGKKIIIIAGPIGAGKRMTPADLPEAKEPDPKSALAALWRASELARKTAIETDTDLVIVRDGQLTLVKPETLREQAAMKNVRDS